jgi:hypothetical protein
MLDARLNMVLAGITAIVLALSPAFAQNTTFNAELKGASEVPPTDSTGSGKAQVTVDTGTKKISWMVTFNGLAGNPIAAHFHGPAAPGENAGIVIDISANLRSGSANVSDQQIADLQAGKWYINIHTAKFPNGEIRGQIQSAP